VPEQEADLRTVEAGFQAGDVFLVECVALLDIDAVGTDFAAGTPGNQAQKQDRNQEMTHSQETGRVGAVGKKRIITYSRSRSGALFEQSVRPQEHRLESHFATAENS
jgi:hypothetical protein